MEFPDFDNTNDIQIGDDNTPQNYNQNNDDFYAQMGESEQNNNTPLYDNNNDGQGFSGGVNAMDWSSSPMDPEEQKRIDARREEEEERRNKINEKIRKELEDKQNTRKDAAEWLQRWEERRQGNIEKKREFNKANEEEFLKNREEAKKGNTNPWDKVIDHIQLKESEHKGIRDISRMKSVILQRKLDFVNMKMKS